MTRAKKVRDADGRCPECGGGLFLEKTRILGGTWDRILDRHGNIEGADLDGVRMAPRPKTVRCVDCDTRLDNPRQE